MDAPGHLLALRRHSEDLRDRTHGGVESRGDKEQLFEEALRLLDPVARQALGEVDQYLLDGTGEIHDPGMQRDSDGTTSRTWSLSWPEQRDRGISAVEIVAWFGGSFHHPHLRGATVRDWALNVYAEPDAQDLLPVLRAVVAADVHNLIFQADWQIIPAVRR